MLEVQVGRWKRDHVAEAHVDLDVDSRFGQTCLDGHSDATAAVLFPGRLHVQCGDVEHQAVVLDSSRGDLAHRCHDRGFVAGADAEQIEVTGWPVGLTKTDREEHGVEDELVPPRQPRQTIQEPLGRGVHERQREVLAPRLGHAEEARRTDAPTLTTCLRVMRPSHPVGAHHPRHPQAPSWLPQLAGRALPETAVVAQRLNGDIDADLVAELDAVTTVRAGLVIGTRTPSMSCSSIPVASAAPTVLKTGTGTKSTLGLPARRSTAIQTSRGC